MSKFYRIHPSIGVARLGSSPEFYQGPTTPGVPAGPWQEGSYRDPGHSLKCQAAGFWVFEYDSATPAAAPVLVKAGAGQQVSRIEWTVHPANKKALWFKFAGLTGSKDITNPPGYGYAPGSLRNPNPTAPAARRAKLVIDPGPRKLGAPLSFVTFDKATGGGYPEAWPDPVTNAEGTASYTSLGLFQVHADFSMTFVPAPGFSGSTDGSGIGEFANNPNWFDNTADGPVRATVVMGDGTRVEADPAWLIIAPPDYAPGVQNIVTLYDVMFDIGVRFFKTRPDIYIGPPPAGVDDFTSTTPPFNQQYTPSYREDIYPILQRIANYQWVHREGSNRHLWNYDELSTRPFTGAGISPADIFGRVRKPENWNASDRSEMPVLWGDTDNPTWLTVTPTQYHTLRQWAAGQFSREGWAFPVPAPAPRPLAAADLDRASLEACAGGAFFPGIELGWIARERKVFSAPFRFRHPSPGGDPLGLDPATADPFALYPGDATKRMACPWQADFIKCNTRWWPAQRPDEVVVNAASMAREAWARGVDLVGGTSVGLHMGLVVNWSQLGVVVPTAAAPGSPQIQRDRELP